MGLFFKAVGNFIFVSRVLFHRFGFFIHLKIDLPLSKEPCFYIKDITRSHMFILI